MKNILALWERITDVCDDIINGKAHECTIVCAQDDADIARGIQAVIIKETCPCRILTNTGELVGGNADGTETVYNVAPGKMAIAYIRSGGLKAPHVDVGYFKFERAQNTSA